MSERDLDRRRFLSLGPAAMTGMSLAAVARADNAAKEQQTLSLQRDVPLRRSYDLVVCGGGPSGVAAALAAGRAGLDVLLVEGQGQLGGMGTSGLVSHWLGGRTSDCQQWVVAGVFRHLSEAAARRGAALIPLPDPQRKYQPHGWYKGQLAAGIPFDPYGVAVLLDEVLLVAGVDVLLLTQAAEVVTAGNEISHVVLFNKSGFSAVPARAVIDATGDADIAARSGCPFVKGRDSDGLMTPTSLTFHVDQVDQEALSEYIHEHDCPRFRKKIAQLREAGEWTFPYEIFICVQLHEPGTMMINTTRLVGIDGTDGASKTDGMLRGREEVRRLMKLMQAHFPGFAKARLKAVAPLLGVRETRRIRGEFVLSVADLNEAREFADTIGFSAYGWDLPNPVRPSDNPGHGRKRSVTPIPYRALVPTGMTNLICPGRAVSAERAVLGPLRVSAPCMAMGEASGQAAVQVVRRDVPFAKVDAEQLRKELVDGGAIVDGSQCVPVDFDASTEP